MLPLKHFMKSDVATVRKNTAILDAIEFFAKYQISSIPVVGDGNKLIGELSEAYILKILLDENICPSKSVENFMSEPVDFFLETQTAVEVCEYFIEKHKRKVPVIRDGKLVGIITSHDIIKLIVDLRKKLLNHTMILT
ncbi:CBS domain-containing protein [bacterium]|nr:CBS domain-containing protein [bacterium]